MDQDEIIKIINTLRDGGQTAFIPVNREWERNAKIRQIKDPQLCAIVSSLELAIRLLRENHFDDAKCVLDMTNTVWAECTAHNLEPKVNDAIEWVFWDAELQYMQANTDGETVEMKLRNGHVVKMKMVRP